MDKGGGVRSSETVLALVHHVPTLTSARMMPMPMSIRPTSKKTMISIIAMKLLLSQMMMTMLVSSASPMTISSEVDDILADEQEEERTLSAVLTRRTEQNNVSPAEGFLLDREAVVRFVQDSFAHAVNRQKRNADKNGRPNVLSCLLKAI